MLDVRHTAFAGKIFEKSLLIQYRVRFALLLIILGQPFIEGCNSIKIPDFRHFLTSFPSFIRSRIQWTACNIYPKTSFPFGHNAGGIFLSRGAVAGRLPADHAHLAEKVHSVLEDSAVSLLERRNPALRTQKQRVRGGVFVSGWRNAEREPARVTEHLLTAPHRTRAPWWGRRPHGNGRVRRTHAPGSYLSAACFLPLRASRSTLLIAQHPTRAPRFPARSDAAVRAADSPDTGARRSAAAPCGRPCAKVAGAPHRPARKRGQIHPAGKCEYRKAAAPFPSSCRSSR